MLMVSVQACKMYGGCYSIVDWFQIMEWMTDVATISALRLSRSQLVLEGIESVHFRGPSYMGERISLLSSVNKVFSNKRYVDARTHWGVPGKRPSLRKCPALFFAVLWI